jgi:hypothetical protein
MNAVWITPIQSKNWSIIFKEKKFGVSFNIASKLEKIEIGDYLAFLLLSSKKGIIGLGRVISKPYIENIGLWTISEGVVKYPYRVNLHFDEKLLLTKKTSIPLYKVAGYYNKEPEYTIEPLLKDVNFFQLAYADSVNLFSLIKEIKS